MPDTGCPSITFMPLRRGRVDALVAVLGTSLFLAEPAGAAIEIRNASLSARSSATTTEFIPVSPFTSSKTFSDSESEDASAPLFLPRSTRGGAGDFKAESAILVPKVIDNEQPFAAARQFGTSNAVAAQSVYSDLHSLKVDARTFWSVTVVNAGPAPAPVDFSFYLSGGSMKVWCTACVANGLTAATYASIVVSGSSPAPLPSWTFSSSLIGHTNGPPTPDNRGSNSLFTNDTGTDAASFLARDNLGIGFPTTTLRQGADELPYTVLDIGAFNAVAQLGVLDPGEEMRIVYSLGAAVGGTGSAYGGAWLVDPFSLGAAGNLPSAQFAVNGVPVSFTAVPLPASVWSMSLACALLRRRRRTL